MGGITIPCSVDTFLDLTSRLSVWASASEVNLGSESSLFQNSLDQMNKRLLLVINGINSICCGGETSAILKLFATWA
jgi:hypothetical protein